MDNFSAHAHGGCPHGHSETDAIAHNFNFPHFPYNFEEEVQLPPPDPVELGYFNGNGNSAEVAQGVCVLVASYLFKGWDVGERNGNAEDLINLRKTFEKNRHCKFYELDAPSESDLLAFLENQQNKLTKAFNLKENDKPSMLILVILSHGHIDGEILTETQGDELTTYKVMESLQKAQLFKDSLKLVIFGACRGDLRENMASESKVTRKNEYKEVVGATECERENAYRVSSQPNEKNFIIVYSSVETTVSWRMRLVHALCYCLNNLPEDTALPDLLTMVKSRIQTEGEGQSVQVVYFPHKPLTIYKSVGGECRNDKYLSYPVKSESGHEFLREAVIYCKNGDSKAALDVKTFLEGLNFEPKFRADLVKAAETFKNSVSDKYFERVGFMIFCIFGKLESIIGQGKHEQICVEGNPIQSVVSGFIGSTHANLDRKPKIFFFVDRPMETDSRRENKVEFKKGGTFFNGVMIVILTGGGAEKHLTEIFTKLSKDEGTLQNAIHHVFEDIYKNTAQEIHPRILSTVPCPVYFPTELYILPKLRLTHFCLENKTIQSSSVTHPYKSSDIDELVRELFNLKTSGEANHEAKQAKNSGPQIFLVSSAAGMGKTHLSKRICKSFKKQFPSMGNNVFEIQLSEAYSYFDKPNSSMPGLIKETCKVDCDLKTTRLLCLDGFDEMSTTNCGKMIKLIDKTLKKCPHITLWITTRPHEAPDIKKVLQPHNYLLVEILPLDKEAQKQMFSYHSKSDDKKGSYEKFKSLLGSRAKELLENPLFFKMIWELVKDEPDGQQELNIFDIYDKIINKKLRDSLGRNDFSDELLNLIKAATSYLGKEPDYSFLDKSEVMILNKTGLISVDKDKKRASFEHRTFAEYLVTRQVLGLYTFPGKFSYFSYDDIFNDALLSHCRYFLEQYFQRGEREISLNIKDKFNCFLNDHGEIALLVKLSCKEGLFNIFKMIPQTGVEIYSNVRNFLTACESNEDLALALIDNGFQVESLFHSKYCNQIKLALRTIFRKNSKRLFDKISSAFPSEKGKLFEFLKTPPSRIESFLGLIFGQYRFMFGLNPLHMVAEHGDIEMLKLIIASGADIKLKSTDWYQETVLLRAVRLSPDIEVVKFLIEQGADPFSERNRDGQNCLHLAANAGKLELVNFLTSLDPSKWVINATDKKGQTALHFAAKKGHLEIIKALCEAGVADVKSRDSKGRTALYIAVKNRNSEIIKYFAEKDPAPPC